MDILGPDGVWVGVGPLNMDPRKTVGDVGCGWSLHSDGDKRFDGREEEYAAAFKNGDVLTVCVDMGKVCTHGFDKCFVPSAFYMIVWQPWLPHTVHLLHGGCVKCTIPIVPSFTQAISLPCPLSCRAPFASRAMACL